MKLFKLIASAFKSKKPETTETYITQLPNFEEVQEVADFIETKYQTENAQLRAENLKFKKEKEFERKKKEKAREENQVLQVVYERKLEQQQLTQSRSLKIKIEGFSKKQLPTFFLKNNRPFGQFQGIYLQETEDGGLLYYPWLRINDQDVKFEKPARNFEDFFKQNIGIVNQIRGGKVDSNFDIDDEGNAMLRIKHQVFDNDKKKPLTVEDLKRYDEVRKLDDTKLRELEMDVEKFRGQAQEANGAIIEEIEEKKELEKELADKEIRAKVSEKDAELYGATIAAEAKQKEATTKLIADSLVAIQDTKTSQILTERMNQQLIDSHTRLVKKWGDQQYKEAGEMQESKTKDLIKAAVQEAATSMRAVQASPPQPQPTPAT